MLDLTEHVGRRYAARDPNEHGPWGTVRDRLQLADAQMRVVLRAAVAQPMGQCEAPPRYELQATARSAPLEARPTACIHIIDRQIRYDSTSA